MSLSSYYDTVPIGNGGLSPAPIISRTTTELSDFAAAVVRCRW
jgi:hypothetical protein